MTSLDIKKIKYKLLRYVLNNVGDIDFSLSSKELSREIRRRALILKAFDEVFKHD